MTKTINITIEVYDGTETGKIENIISAEKNKSARYEDDIIRKFKEEL